MTTEHPDLQALAARQLAALADALADESTVADQPSLCAGWKVRNVLAHMTMAARYDPPAFMRELAAAGNDFQTLSETVARRDGELPMAQLLADLRSDTMAVWAPPGGGAMGALTHAVIHGLDITSALGLPRSADDEATRIVLTALADGLAAHFGTTTSGRRLRATDLDWRFGEGPSVDATAADLILALAGRHRDGLDLRTAA
ncbi:MAG TPA: maleylpyruvate isomerase family mycothiol-dependent enzyme [Lapillicoccus sp.]|nr:maleylpyruvate isomerase family mycothiol-dependent enzyme [Lapillicoccus sp.]